MNRLHVIAVAALLIAIGASVWNLWRLSEPAASDHERLTRPALSVPNASLPDYWRAGGRELFTFAQDGRTITVDLEKVRHSHDLLVRQPSSRPNVTAAGAPDPDFNFLSWPGRKFHGVETIKTRKCWVIDFTAPERAGRHYLVRLYVDQKLSGLMRMQAYNWSQKLTLEYAVTAGRRVNGELTVSRAEAKHFEPGTHRVVQKDDYRAQP